MLVETLGRRQWKKKKMSVYHRQGQVEDAFFPYKSIIGGGLRTRSRPPGRENDAVNRRIARSMASDAPGYVCHPWASARKVSALPCERLRPFGHTSETLRQLLELNAQRAREEQLQVSRAPGSKTRKSTISRASNPLLDT